MVYYTLLLYYVESITSNRVLKLKLT